jgi:hypothetical protein
MRSYLRQRWPWARPNKAVYGVIYDISWAASSGIMAGLHTALCETPAAGPGGIGSRAARMASHQTSD